MQAVPVTVEQLVGQTFGNFSVDLLLGQGSLSAAYLAHQSNSERRALLTIFLLPSWCEEQQRVLFMERFSKIASVLVSLDHPHILPTLDFGEKFGYPYLVTDFLEEISLASVLKQQIRCTPVQTLALLKQIADALDYLHARGMVYGTLKPTNILVDSEQKVHLTGLGLAHILEMHGLGTTQYSLPHLYSIADTLLYSPQYLAPEVIAGKPPDVRSDMYMLGCIVYELLSGKPPFTGDDPLAVAIQYGQRSIPSLQSEYTQAPAALDLIVQRMLDRNPDRRYKSACKLASMFERVLNVLDAATNPVAALRANPVSLLDISERPTLPWFEADAPSLVQWSSQAPNTANTGSIALGLKSVMPPAVPWHAVRSAIEDATQQESSSTMQSPPQQMTEDLPIQPSPSLDADQTQAAASGVLPSDAWPTNGPEASQEPAPGAFQSEGDGEKPAQQRSLSPMSRRKLLLFASGGIAATGLLALGGLSLAHLLPSIGWQSRTATTPKSTGIKNAGARSMSINSEGMTTPTSIPPKNTATVTPTSVVTIAPKNTVTITPTSTATSQKRHKSHKS